MSYQIASSLLSESASDVALQLAPQCMLYVDIATMFP